MGVEGAVTEHPPEEVLTEREAFDLERAKKLFPKCVTFRLQRWSLTRETICVHSGCAFKATKNCLFKYVGKYGETVFAASLCDEHAAQYDSKEVYDPFPWK